MTVIRDGFKNQNVLLNIPVSRQAVEINSE